MNDLSNLINSTYDYNIGTFDNNPSFLDSEKFLAKLNFNITKDHKLSLRYSFVQADNLEARRSSSGAINFLTGSEFLVSTTNSTALELSSVLSNTMSNKLSISATFVRDDQDQSGPEFPTVFLEDGDGGIILGSDPLSVANLLKQDVITIKNDLNIYKGKHNFLIGANVELFDAGNLFIRNNFEPTNGLTMGILQDLMPS